MTNSYPLKWPDGWPRNKKLNHYGTQFKTTLDKSRSRLYFEMEKLNSSSVVISSNLELTMRGEFRGDKARMQISDPGVAVYFSRRGKQYVMARDAYNNVFDNFHSIVLAVEALRSLERHGGGQMLEKAFDGFTALPEPGNASHRRPWWKVFDLPSDPATALQCSSRLDKMMLLDHCEKIYRRLAMAVHPDRPGGSHDQMAELTAAITKAREVLNP